MLTIRSAQLAALATSRLDEFASKLGAELLAEFPVRSAELGPRGVAAWIAHGVARADGYGIDSVEATARYIRLMFVFGRDFDIHPDLPWVRVRLGDAGIGQDAKINALTADLQAYVARLLAAQAAR